MGFYNRFIMPRMINCACGMKAVRKQREKVVPLASGVVLEIGIGSGLNLPHYDPDKVTKIIGVDPDDHIWKQSRKRREACTIPIERMGLSGEEIPMDSDAVDCVVCTYTLCTIPDPVKALHEMRRILKPGGQILFAEHGKAPDEKIFQKQVKMDRWWGKLAGGCHTSRDIPGLFQEAGLALTSLETMYLPGGPRTLGFNYWGAAE